MSRKISYQGVVGSFSSMAARALYGNGLIPLQTRRFREIFENVQQGRADAGVIPIENALAGSVHETYDLLGEFKLTVVAEYYCPVQLHLLGLPSEENSAQSFARLREVVSHPKALEQCSLFLEQHPSLTPVVYSDTAGAALMIKERGDRTIGAIASIEACHEYGLTVLTTAIQNHPTNSTRFVAVARQGEVIRDATKGSLLFTLPHEPGSLHRITGIAAKAGTNITKIESRPIAGKPFEYTFHLDVECHPDHSGKLLGVIDEIRKATNDCHILGVYKAATTTY